MYTVHNLLISSMFILFLNSCTRVYYCVIIGPSNRSNRERRTTAKTKWTEKNNTALYRVDRQMIWLPTVNYLLSGEAEAVAQLLQHRHLDLKLSPSGDSSDWLVIQTIS